MHEQQQLAQLKRMRSLATGLLLLMALLFVIARLLMPRYPHLSFVAAFAEAAMVGALADWFAVTALFRSPLGLPIPHTAIIPRNKDRIGDSLASFLEHNFITQEVIRAELRRIDFAGLAAGWLSEPDNSRAVARQLVRGVPALLELIEDDDVQRFIQERAGAAVAQVRFAPVLAELLSALVASGHHQLLFNRLIDVAGRALEHNHSYIHWKVHESSPRWLPNTIVDKLYERLLGAVQGTLDEMRDDDSEWRLRFQNATEELIGQLRTSPEYEARIDAVVGDILSHPQFRDYAIRVWHDVKARLLADASAPDSRMAARLEQGVRSSGVELLGRPEVRAKLNQWLRIRATEVIVERRQTIAELVARVIHQWDADTMSRKLELYVGKDLQYIRINGTLVGGLVGLLLHLVSLAL